MHFRVSERPRMEPEEENQQTPVLMDPEDRNRVPVHTSNAVLGPDGTSENRRPGSSALFLSGPTGRRLVRYQV
ncbi:hypothetical protein EYF80_038560 [Liparis tanakae]|uniref:Uncharacterized protein n=1 Tax=Liparis tanakae TaxID=230148 RepID=A0A4Z2GD99_9TELE|nr:hypothetical protein EYF80_038560 [Liparis tanakae]